MIVIREERSDDYPVTRRVVEAAFGRRGEADLIDSLRHDGDLDISLVAHDGDLCVGYVGLSRMRSPERCLGLGPVAVLPARQRQGVGSALIRGALEQAAQRDYGLVFVLGAPDYYGRFGFSTDLAAQFPCAYAGPYFMALRLSPTGFAPVPAVYANAFEGLT